MMVSMRRAFALIMMVMAVAGFGIWGAVSARAVGGDVVESWDVTQRVDEAGLLHVSETLVWRFGSNSGRHGIVRTLATREPVEDADEPTDALYEISDIKVTSPDAPTDLSTENSCTPSNRSCELELQIGDPDVTVDAPTATYTIEYTVSGTMRSFAGHDEFHWDVVGPDTPEITRLSVGTEVPGAPQQVVCFAGPVGSTTPCTSAQVVQGRASFTQEPKLAGEIMTVSVAITPGLVSDNQPHLRPAALSGVRRFLPIGGGAIALSVFFSAARVLMTRQRLRDEPAPQEPVEEPAAEGEATEESGGGAVSGMPVDEIISDPDGDNAPDEGDLTAATAYHQPPHPPEISPALGGYLADGRLEMRDVMALLLDLAVRGALQIGRDSRARHITLRLVDPSLITEKWEQVVVVELFGKKALEPSTKQPRTLTLTDSTKLIVAAQTMFDELSAKATSEGLILHPGRRPEPALGMWGVIRLALGAVLLAFIGGLLILLVGDATKNIALGAVIVLSLIGVLAPLLVMAVINQRIIGRVQLSAAGSALADRIRGWSQLLRDGRADAFRADADRDLFNEMLGWAVAVGREDEWVRLCEDLTSSKAAFHSPAWYDGTWTSRRGLLWLTRAFDRAAGTVEVSSSSR